MTSNTVACQAPLSVGCPRQENWSNRPHEVEEATGALILARKCFRHLALDYVLQVSRWALGVTADRDLVSGGAPLT